MADRVRSIQVLLQLRELGVRIAVYDYGTGYSSLATSASYPFRNSSSTSPSSCT